MLHKIAVVLHECQKIRGAKREYGVIFVYLCDNLTMNARALCFYKGGPYGEN